MRTKRSAVFFLFLLVQVCVNAQQLPYFTQFRPNSIIMNPAVAGTKRLLDVRLDYRNQWVGYDANPKTQGLDINSKLMKGTMGVGLSMYKDVTGYTKRSLYSLAYAYHIKFPDISLSLGMNASMINYFIDGSKITLRDAHDQAVTLGISDKDRTYDMGAGMLLYNDRFHFGFSALDLLSSKIKFYDGDTTKSSSLKMVPHTYVTVGYNWSGNPMFVWENSLQANFVSGSPFQVDYNLRVHYKELVMTGISIRRHDAIAFHIGYTYKGDLQISYSYDVSINPMRTYHSNTHEIMLIYSTNLPRFFGKRGNMKEFQRQKFAYMF